ncbi:bifunctional uridylate/adenylate kinase [Elasticomyces elasticus]|nr:bifunctional uridylate/adenylate kinase [Elasticomyces elasticus]KAK3646691.1 bifunctional uridylate/adenylate kinase [Elasticomyces elasticus]KAK4924211.1 bifunctional uridylate/adenylate kinase [Elasticomyces elasticus]KAK5746545.1 bifunctional uridylate/adenylate kinase [Elasticomyces elasticus]
MLLPLVPRVLRTPIKSTSTRYLSSTSKLREAPRSQLKPATSTYVPTRRNNQNQLPVYPLIAIFLLGSGSFYWIVKTRAALKDNPALQAPKRSKPLFSQGVGSGQALVVFVLGGPGAGKGTQCANIVRDYGFQHLSAGDLLRAEQDREGSEFGDMIKTYIKEGQIVPMEVTIQLLENAMTHAIEKDNKRKFLIDGFPRKMDQAIAFEEKVVPSKFTLFFDVSEEEMRKRLLKRGETSGRSDDNEESITKRFRTFVETSMPVVEMFEKEGRVVKVDARKGPEEVYEGVKAAFGKEGIEMEKK